MEDEIKIFENNEFGSIRTTTINDKVYFVGKDIAKALGFKDTINAIKQHCRGVVKHHLTDSLGRTQKTNFIPESDIYRLVFRSKLPSAEKFSDWVCKEVLPSIRKHGVYMTDNLLDQITNNPEYFITVLTRLNNERKEKEKAQKIAKQRQEIIEMQKPKVEYYNDVLQDESLISATELAKSLGISSARKLNQILYQKGVQFKRGNHWLLYALYAERGYAKTKVTKLPDGSIIEHTYWTQKGKKFVYDLLKKDSGD